VLAALGAGLLAESGHMLILNEHDHLRYSSIRRTFTFK
jgi:hypothetical protein